MQTVLPVSFLFTSVLNVLLALLNVDKAFSTIGYRAQTITAWNKSLQYQPRLIASCENEARIVETG